MRCIVEDCERDVHVKSRGLCKMHYARWYKHGDPTVVKPPGFAARLRPVCKVEGCQSIAKQGGRGWCGRHYTRWYRHGDPSIDGNKLRQRTPVIKRILSRLSVGGLDECWLWQGARLPNGYGVIDRGNRYVHRRMYEHFRGPIPAGLHLHHTCEVKACANPKHLVPVTRLEHTAIHRRVAA